MYNNNNNNYMILYIDLHTPISIIYNIYNIIYNTYKLKSSHKNPIMYM